MSSTSPNPCPRCNRELPSLRPCHVCGLFFCDDCYFIHAANCTQEKA